MSKGMVSRYVICLGITLLIFCGGYRLIQASIEQVAIQQTPLSMKHSPSQLRDRVSLYTNPQNSNTGNGRRTMTHGARAAISSNYAGYALQQQSGNFTTVSGNWIMPKVTCPQKQNSEVAFWVGLTGKGTGSTIAQIAALGLCQNGQASYEADWELFPASARKIAYPIRPGDSLTATVSYTGGKFRMALSDANQGWGFTTTRSGSASNASIAECITEAPTLTVGGTQTGITNLADFGSVNISCQANAMPIGNYALLYQYQMVAANAIGSTSALDGSGSVFGVTWEGK